MSICNWVRRIRESSCAGKWEQLLSFYYQLNKAPAAGLLLLAPTETERERDVKISLFPPILKACSHLPSHHAQGESLHASLIKQGLQCFPPIGNSILSFYIRRRELNAALGVFHAIESRDSVSWNILVHGFLHLGDLTRGSWWFNSARGVDGFEPNVSTLLLLLDACAELRAKDQGEKLHAYFTKNGFLSVLSIHNSLLRFYAHMEGCARKLFDEMTDKDIISWSVMISGYVKSEEADVALHMFREMVCQRGIEPDGVVLVTVLNACSELEDIGMGRLVHGLVICRGLDHDLFVHNSLIDMYSKCGDMGSGFKIFHDMSARNNVSWNSMLSGFVCNEDFSGALSLTASMSKEGVSADEVTLVNILQICKHFARPSWTQSVHCFIIRRSSEYYNELVVNSLIDAYASCDLVELAWEVFVRMKRKDVVLWSTMIAGFVHCGQPEEAIATFLEMNGRKVIPNAITITKLLEACAVSAELERSKWAHGIAVRRGFALKVAVGTAIVDMYSKCGEIEASRKAFNQIPHKNIVTWSAMIAGCAANGLAREALALLAEMKLLGLRPNAVTILSVLTACSHGGLVEEGLSLFRAMVRDWGVEPGAEHYSCVVDMLGRAGMLDAAGELIEGMGADKEMKDSASAWGALLSACRSYGNSKVGEGAICRILALEPQEWGGYLMASKMYGSHGWWGDAERMRLVAKGRGVKVVAGYSLVNVGNKAHRFVAGDPQLHSHSHSHSHPEVGQDGIRGMVKQLHVYMMNQRECPPCDVLA